jgi:predicted nucleic acid-binding protein
MPFVLDASVTLAWILDDEDHPIAQHAFERIPDDQPLVPSMWWFEVRNALLMGERKKRSTVAITTTALGHLAKITIAVDADPDERSIFQLSRRHQLTFYDAAYLELAARRRCPLATLDRALLRAARKEDVSLLGPD